MITDFLYLLFTVLMQTMFGYNGMDVDEMSLISCHNVFMVGTTRKKLSSVYRLSVIRQITHFRTVSDEAILLLAKT